LTKTAPPLDEMLAREIKPTPERFARAEEAGAPIQTASVEGRHVRRLYDDSVLARLNRGGTISDDQYDAGDWLRETHRKSLDSIGSVELKERVDGGGTVTPEMIIAARKPLQDAFAAIRRDAGEFAALVVEDIVLVDHSLRSCMGKRQKRHEAIKEALVDGLAAVCEWRVLRGG